MPDAGGGPLIGTRPLLVLQIGLNWFGSGSGGLDRVYADLVAALPDFGIGVSGAVVGPADVAASTGGRLRAFSPSGGGLLTRLLGARLTIAEMVRIGGFDLVAAHFALHVATALDRLRGLPLVMHFHGPWADEARYEGAGRIGVAAKRAVEKLVYRRADRVIVLSRAFARLACSRYGVPEERIRVVPGSVDLARFDSKVTRNEARDRLGWPKDRPILLAVRRLTPRMGLDRLIAALPQIVACVPETLLCVAGRGPAATALKLQATELGLEPNIRFLGFVPEQRLPLVYRAADINVVPTAGLEGFGLTAAEALAAGTPSMVTPVGGLPEVVADLSPELVFAGGSTHDLSAGLIEALLGRRRLPDAFECRLYAAERFDVALAALRTAEIYRELAG